MPLRWTKNELSSLRVDRSLLAVTSLAPAALLHEACSGSSWGPVDPEVYKCELSDKTQFSSVFVSRGYIMRLPGNTRSISKPVTLEVARKGEIRYSYRISVGKYG